jgi:N-acetylmuramidase-like protein/putative peptidoglycan binding protein
MEFAGNGRPLSIEGFTEATDRLGVAAAALWAVIRVETGGVGFLSDRRPQILFERHIFHKETAGVFDATASDISNAVAGEYGASGSHQYDRLAAAIALRRSAALRSASWGLGQIMGFHAEALHYPNVEAMVREMVESEDAQLRAMAGFLANAGLDKALQRRAWAAFARGYNGADFARNHYDEKLAREYQNLAIQGLPDLRVRTAQVYLTYHGFSPGRVDGRPGNLTRKALERFQAQCGLAVSGALDDETFARLIAA